MLGRQNRWSGGNHAALQSSLGGLGLYALDSPALWKQTLLGRGCHVRFAYFYVP